MPQTIKVCSVCQAPDIVGYGDDYRTRFPSIIIARAGAGDCRAVKLILYVGLLAHHATTESAVAIVDLCGEIPRRAIVTRSCRVRGVMCQRQTILGWQPCG